MIIGKEFVYFFMVILRYNIISKNYRFKTSYKRALTLSRNIFKSSHITYFNILVMIPNSAKCVNLIKIHR